MVRPIIGNTTATPTPRSDWNQNDPNKADYIKNRPFYKEETKVNCVEFLHNESGVYMVHIDIRENDLYYIDVVDIDGNSQSYSATLHYYDQGYGQINTDDFDIKIYDQDILLPSDYTFQKMTIYNLQTTYHTIPQEYLNLEGMIPTPNVSGSEVFVISVNVHPGVYPDVDKTFSEIADAYRNKKIIQMQGEIGVWSEEGQHTYYGAVATLNGIENNKMWFDFHIGNHLCRLIGRSDNTWTMDQYNLATIDYVNEKVSVQPNWNQNDSTQLDYIKNRPFYKEEVVVDYIELPCDGKIDGAGIYADGVSLIENYLYTVEIISVDGTVKNTYSLRGIRDEDLTSTYLEFAEGLIRNQYYEWYAPNISAFRVSGDGIQSTETIYHKISQEYLDLPDMLSVFVVNVTIANDGTVSADKTYNDIFMAYSEGKIIQCINVSGGYVGLLVVANSSQVMFIFNEHALTRAVFCYSNNTWISYLYEVEYAEKSYVDNAIQEAIIDSWSEVTAPNGMTINETEVSE